MLGALLSLMHGWESRSVVPLGKKQRDVEGWRWKMEARRVVIR